MDVGVDQPTDVAITQIEMKPQVVPQGQTVVLNATLATAGAGVETTMKCKVAGASPNAPMVPEQTKQAVIPASGTAGVSFTIPEALLRPGLYQAELRIETADNLMFDNVRYVTFKVAEPRKILTISDDPGEALWWQLANDAKGEFHSENRKPSEVGPLAKYEAVVLLNVTNPTALWPKPSSAKSPRGSSSRRMDG